MHQPETAPCLLTGIIFWIGLFGLAFVAIKTGLCKLPNNVSWLSLSGVSSLCGNCRARQGRTLINPC